MGDQRSVVINGDLGSGKTTISVALAGRLGLRRVSIGDLYRRMAQDRGMTALQLNLHAELDDTVDGHVDRLQREIAASGERLVVDSRLAWFFFTDAVKVHLITEPTVAARRVLARPSSEVEAYSSVEEAIRRLGERGESERERFLARYGVDKARLRNYDLVCDTTRATPDEVVDRIAAAVAGPPGGDGRADAPPLLLLDPARIRPPGPATGQAGPPEPEYPEPESPEPESPEPIPVRYAGSQFSPLGGYRRLAAAVHSGVTLVRARLVAEGDEPVAGRLTGARFGSGG